VGEATRPGLTIGDLGDAALGDLGDAALGDLGDAALGDLGDAALGDLGDAALEDEEPEGLDLDGEDILVNVETAGGISDRGAFIASLISAELTRVIEGAVLPLGVLTALTGVRAELAGVRGDLVLVRGDLADWFCLTTILSSILTTLFFL